MQSSKTPCRLPLITGGNGFPGAKKCKKISTAPGDPFRLVTDSSMQLCKGAPIPDRCRAYLLRLLVLELRTALLIMGTEVLLTSPRSPFAAEAGCRGHASLTSQRWEFVLQGLRQGLAPAGFDIVHPLSVAWCAFFPRCMCLWYSSLGMDGQLLEELSYRALAPLDPSIAQISTIQLEQCAITSFARSQIECAGQSVTLRSVLCQMCLKASSAACMHFYEQTLC